MCVRLTVELRVCHGSAVPQLLLPPWPSAWTLSLTHVASDISAGPRHSQARVSHESRWDRRIIRHLIPVESQYLWELKIHPSCMCGKEPHRHSGRIHNQLLDDGKANWSRSSKCATAAVLLRAHSETSSSTFPFQMKLSFELQFENF